MTMTDSELEILRYFKRFSTTAGQMLFFQASSRTDPAKFQKAMQGLVRRGLVLQEKRRDAYSLTELGYRTTQSVLSPQTR